MKRKRRVIPEGYQVRRAQGRDEKERVVRIQLTFSFDEWDQIEELAGKKNMYPRTYIMWRVLKKLRMT
jgi:hypothetical protein